MLRSVLEYSFLSMYGIALIASIYRYHKYFDTKLNYLPILFCYTLLNEILGYLTAHQPQFSFFSNDTFSYYNHIIYNVYNIIFYLYFFLIYRHYIKSNKIRDSISFAILCFLLVSLINPFFQNFLLSSQTFTYVVGGVILIVCIGFYLKELLKNKRVIFFDNNVLVWISSGLLVFYIGYLPIKVSRYIHFINQTTEAPNVRLAQYGLIILMYLLIIIGFIKQKKRLYD